MREKLPLVTVITPSYNRASYLDETIRSVLGQDYPRIEYIVLDDGSTDNTREVLEKYTGRIVWETHPNMGETRTVNKGFGMAHGDIVVVVNSDDPLLPGAVSAAVAFMQSHPDILVAYPDWNYIGPNSEVTGHVTVPEHDYLWMLRHHHCSVGPGAFIRRKALDLAGPRDPEFRYVGDFEFWLRVGLHGEFARIPHTLATFRIHPDSATVSRRGTAMADEHIRLTDKLFSRPDLPPAVIRARSAAYGSAHLVAAVVCGAQRKEAAKHVFRAAHYGPRGLFSRWELIMPSLLPLPVQTVPQGIRHAWRSVMLRMRRIGCGLVDEDKE
jgi:glycosyltransferase involved in cell wall biosynthesis